MQSFKKDILQFLKKIIFFCVFCVFLYSISITLWGTYFSKRYKPNLIYKPTVGYKRFKEADSTKNIDILFLGSSHAYRGFDTRIFRKEGYKTFNLGSSAQTPLHTKLLVNEYLELFNPKLIVYEVYPKPFTFDGVEASLRIIPNKPNLSTTGLVITHKHAKVLNSHLFSLKHKFLSNEVQIPKSKIDTYVSGGFVERKMSYYSPEKFNSHDIIINEMQLENFKESITIFKKMNIPYILVQAPITSTRYNSFSNITYFNNLMSKQGTYFNFNVLMKLDDSLHFYDSHHLNQNGVSLFNDKFIKDVVKKMNISK
tara:strand:+ start:55901 stop:56836 length:936 start_codon:yes stop_codon:yes gene_type:complete